MAEEKVNLEEVQLTKNSLLEKKDIEKSYWIWQFFSHANYNYERLQASAFAASMASISKKLHPDDKEKRSEMLKRHMLFFNTEPNFGTVIHGLVTAMEEQKAMGADIDEEAITSIKTGLMGPLAGLGDTLTQGTIIPLLLAIGISIGQSGSIFGPLFFLFLCPITLILIARTFWMRGYYSGKEAVSSLLGSERFKSIIRGTTILGVLVMGALIAQFVNLSIAPQIQIDQTVLNIQTDIFDKIIPKLIPFALTLGIYKLLQKEKSPLMLMVVIIVVAIVGAYIGLF